MGPGGRLGAERQQQRGRRQAPRTASWRGVVSPPGQSAAAEAIRITRPGNSWRSGNSSPCSQRRPEARGQRGGDIRPQVRAEHRPVVVRPTNPYWRRTDTYAAATVPTHARMSAAATASQPSGAQPIRAGHRARRELADHDERRRDREIVEKVAVRERLGRERDDEDRERRPRGCGGGPFDRRHEPVQAPQARSASSPTPAPGDARRAARASARTRTSARRGTRHRGVRSARAPAGTSRSRRGRRSEETRRRSARIGLPVSQTIGATKHGDAQHVLRERDRVAARKQDRRVPERAEAVKQPVGVPAQQPAREQGIAEVAGQRTAEVKTPAERSRPASGRRTRRRRARFPRLWPSTVGVYGRTLGTIRVKSTYPTCRTVTHPEQLVHGSGRHA